MLIMVVEDDTVINNWISGVLQKKGYTVLFTAYNGQEALEFLNADNAVLPNIIVTDIYMPKVDGVQLINAVTLKFKTIKCIACSMYEKEEVAINAMEAGAVGFIAKNNVEKGLEKAINAVLNNELYFDDKCFPPWTEKKLMKAYRNMYKDREGLHLTEHQLYLLQVIATDIENKNLHSAAGCSKKAMKNFQDKMKKQYGIGSRISIMLWAIKHKLVKITNTVQD
jgi:two-component system, NarL family, invasion response regulator UvrY